MANKGRDHESTWGASEPVKEQWERQNGDAARKETEKRAEAVAKGERDA